MTPRPLRRSSRFAAIGVLTTGVVLATLTACGQPTRTGGANDAAGSTPHTAGKLNPLSSPSAASDSAPAVPSADPHKTITLTTGRKSGSAPGWARGGVWHTTTGDVRFDYPDSVYGLAEAGDWLLVERVIGEGPDGGLDLLTRDGRLDRSTTIRGRAAVDPAGDVAAWAEPDGTVRSLGANGEVSLARQKPGTTVTSIVSAGSCREALGGGCLVTIYREGKRATFTDSHGITIAVAKDAVRAGDVSEKHVVIVTEENGNGLCNRVAPLRRPASTRWASCELEMGSFSPNGRLLIASDDQVEGLGVRFLDVRATRTGVPALRLDAPAGGMLSSVQWADDTHLLVVDFDGKRFQVAKVGLDGSTTRGSAAVRADITGNPFLLASR